MDKEAKDRLMQKPIPVPRPQHEEPQDNRVFIGLAVAVGIMLLILLMALLLSVVQNKGSGDSGHGNNGGTQGAESGNAGGEGGEETGGEKDTAGQEGVSASSGTSDADRPEQLSGVEQEAESAQSGLSEDDAVEQGNAGEKSEDSDEKEGEKQAAVMEPANEDSQQLSIAEKLSGITADDVVPDEQEEMETTKQGGGFLGKGDAELSFFGATGKGSKFVYVIDHSGSMAGTPLEAAKKEMLKGLNLLQPHHKFNIIFYDDQYISWTDGRLASATAKARKGATQFVQRISAAGGTTPEPALARAVQAKPEHIFFLSDGEFQMDMKRMCDYANKNKVHINVIQFGDAGTPKDPSLQALASHTKGDYKLVNVSGLDAL